MKVVAVFGSPRKNGLSTSFVNEIIRGAKDANNEVVTYNIGDSDIRGCKACHACKVGTGKAEECVINDVLKPYWKDLKEAGAMILGIPNYMGDVAAQMMVFMNRHFCLHESFRGGNRIPAGIKLVSVFAQGSPNPNQYMDAYNRYLKHFDDWNFARADVIVITFKDKAEPGNEMMQRAYQLGNGL